jgi:hypothetical protein
VSDDNLPEWHEKLRFAIKCDEYDGSDGCIEVFVEDEPEDVLERLDDARKDYFRQYIKER